MADKTEGKSGKVGRVTYTGFENPVGPFKKLRLDSIRTTPTMVVIFPHHRRFTWGLGSFEQRIFALG
jgi:hypothetical protein